MSAQINQIAELWWGWMWPMFWQVGVVIMLVWAVDLVIRRRVWPQVRYALWLLVLLKLILPPGLASPISVTWKLEPLAEEAVKRQWFAEDESPAIHAEEIISATRLLDYTRQARPASTAEAPMPTKTVTDMSAGNLESAEAPETPAKSSVKLCWKAYIMFAWFAGALVLTGWLILRFRQLRRRHIAKNGENRLPRRFGELLAEAAKKLRLRRLPEVVLSRHLVSPAVFGVFRPVLLMPADEVYRLPRRELEHVLLHELSHIKRGDLKVHAFYMVLQIIYWFNPLLWLVRRQLQHLRELCCDATVARILREETTGYRETILETARRLLARPVEPGMGLLGLFEDSSRLMTRLKWLEKKTWKYRGLRIAAVLVIVALMTACVLPMAKGESNKIGFFDRKTLVKFESEDETTGIQRKIGDTDVYQRTYKADFKDNEKLVVIAELYQVGKPMRRLGCEILDSRNKAQDLLVTLKSKYLNDTKTSVGHDVDVKMNGQSLRINDVRVDTPTFLNNRSWRFKDNGAIRIKQRSGKKCVELESLAVLRAFENFDADKGRAPRIWMPTYENSWVDSDAYFIQINLFPFSQLDKLFIGAPDAAENTQLPDGTYLPADASNDDRKAIAKKYREDIKMEILRQSMPLPKLTAHKYYKAGERITIEMKSNAVNWKPSLEEMSDDDSDFFVLVNSKEYEASPCVGPFNGFTCWHIVPYEASKATGKHRFAYGWRNVDVVNPEKPEEVIHFDKLITDEVEFEVVDNVPDSYYQQAYEDGWEDVLRENTLPLFTDDMRKHGVSGPLLALKIKKLPFDIAFDIYAQAEGSVEEEPAGQLAITAGSYNYITGCDRNVKGLTWDNVGDRRWRVILKPSQKAAASHPPIRHYYGREFVTDWLTFERSERFDQHRRRAKAEKNGDADSQSKTAFDPPEMTLKAKKSYGVGEPIELYLSWTENGWIQTADNRAPENEGKWILFLRVNGKDYRQGEYPMLVPRYITAGVTRLGQHFHAREAYSLDSKPKLIEFPPGRYRVCYVFKDVSAARPDEPQRVIHFGDIATNEVEFDVVERDAGSSSKFTATLRNGLTVELLGVCEYPSKGKQWWRPDGTPLILPVGIAIEDRLDRVDDNAYQFLFRYNSQEDLAWNSLDAVCLHFSIEGHSGTDLINMKRLPEAGRDGLVAKVAIFKEPLDSTTIQANLAAGNWQTRAIRDISKIDQRNEDLWWFTSQSAGHTGLDILHRIEGQQIKTIAIDREGNEYNASYSLGSFGGWMRVSGVIKGTQKDERRYLTGLRKDERLVKFKLQSRPYWSSVIGNVSLKPNFKTDVHVGVEESKPVMERPKDVGYKGEGGPLAIRLVGVRPDGGDDIYDAKGKKIAENTFAKIDARWSKDSQYRTFIFELLVPDEQLLFTPFLEIRPAGGEHGLSAGQRHLVYSSDGKLTYSVGARLPRTYKKWFTRRIKQVDLTLRYYYGPRGKADFVFKGPFTAGQTVKAQASADCELTTKEDRLNFSNHPAAFFKVSSKTRFDTDSVLVYDVSGRRHLPEGTGGRSGQYGSSYEYRAEDLTLDWIAYVTVGEKPCERTFENVVVHYPDRPARERMEYLDRMCERLGLSGLTDEQLYQYKFENPADAIKVIDIVRGEWHVRQVFEAIVYAQPKFDVSTLDEQSQHKIRSAAKRWAEAGEPRIRAMGIWLGLYAGRPEFLDLALTALENNLNAHDILRSAYHDIDQKARREIAGGVARYGGAIQSEQADRIREIILRTPDARIRERLFTLFWRADKNTTYEVCLPLASDERAWVWWPAISTLLNRCTERLRPFGSLSDEMLKRLILIEGERPPSSPLFEISASGKDYAALAEEAYSMLPGLFTSELAQMNGSLCHDVQKRLAAYIEQKRAEEVMIEFLHGILTGPIQRLWAEDNTVFHNCCVQSFYIARQFNRWYGVNIGGVGTTYEEHGERIPHHIAALKGLVAETLQWYESRSSEADKAGRADDKAGQSRFMATLANGVTVELIGVCRHPSEGKQWWRPDGGILRAKPYEDSPWTLEGSLYAYEFVYRVTGGEGLMTKFAYGRPFSGGMGPRCLSETNQKINYPDVESLYTCVGTTNEDSNHADLTFLVGNESEWETVTTMESPSENSMVGGVNNVIITAQVEKDGKTYVDVVASRAEKQSRVIAVDKDGKQHVGQRIQSSTKLGGTNVISIRAEFPMPLNRIRSIEYQAQRFTPVIFKNVSLKPNLKTDVQVEDGENISAVTVGYIVDGSGRGIAGATMEFYRWDSKENKTTEQQIIKTGKDGSFVIPYIEPGRHGSFTNITAPGFCTREDVDFVYKKDGTYYPEDKTIQLFRLGTLAGTVLDLDGKPLAGAPLSLSTHVQYQSPRGGCHTFNHIRAITDANGHFSMNIPPGIHLLSYPWMGPIQGEVDSGKWDAYRKPGERWPSAPIKGVSWAKGITISEGQAISGIVADLSKSTCDVAGKVRDTKGQPVQGARVRMLWVFDGGSFILSREGYEPAVTDGNGNYRLENLPPGKWHIKAWHEQVKQNTDPVPLELVRGKTVQQDLRLAGELPVRIEPIATLANGLTVELLGITYIPVKERPWWAPNGEAWHTDKPPFDRVDSDPCQNPYHDQLSFFAIAYRLTGKQSADIHKKWEVTDIEYAGGSQKWPKLMLPSTNNPTAFADGRRLADDMSVASLRVPRSAQKATLRLGISNGDWQTVASGRHTGFYEIGNDTVIIGEPSWGGGPGRLVLSAEGHAIGLTYTITPATNRDFRVTILDKDGNLHEGQRHGSSGADNLRRTNTNFPTLQDPRKIDRYLIQTRTYELIEFKNVSLKPGHKTDVQVEVQERRGRSPSAGTRDERGKASTDNAAAAWPKLEFLAWQREDRKHISPYWHADGTVVTDPNQLRILRHLRPGRYTDTSVPDYKWLHLWFSHPAFDNHSAVDTVRLFRPSGRSPIRQYDSGCEAASPKDFRGNLGWIRQTICLGPLDNYPEVCTVELDYAVGDWKSVGEEIPIDYSGGWALGRDIDLGPIGQNAEGKAFTSCIRDLEKTRNTQCAFTAIKKDGSVLKSSARHTVGPTPARQEKFDFDAPLSEVKAFKFHTRPVKTARYESVSLRPGVKTGVRVVVEESGNWQEGEEIVLWLVDSDGRPVAGAEVGSHMETRDTSEDSSTFVLHQRGDLLKDVPVSDARGRVALPYNERLFDFRRQGRIPKISLCAYHTERRLGAFRQIRKYETGQDITLTLHPLCRLHGTLYSSELNAVGRPLASSIVYGWSGDARVLIHDSRNMRLEFLVPPGVYKLWITGRGSGVRTGRDFYKTVVVKPGQLEMDMGAIDLPANKVASLLGRPASELKPMDAWFNGPPVKLSDLRGKVVMLHFAGTTAGAGRDMPILIDLHEKFKDRGLVLIVIYSTHWDKTMLERQFFEDYGKGKGLETIPFRVALDKGRFRNRQPGAAGQPGTDAAYAVEEYPTNVLIDKRGNIAGQVVLDFGAAEEAIEALLSNGTDVEVEIQPGSGDEFESRSPIPAADNKAMLRAGVDVELLGLTKIPVKDQPWWKPDGSPLEPLFDRVSTDPSRDPNRNQFDYYAVAIRLEGKPADEFGLIKWQLTGATHASSTSAYLGDKLLYYDNIRVASARFPKSVESSDLRIGLACGQWKTIAAGTHMGFYRSGDDSIFIGQPQLGGGLMSVRPGEKGLHISVTYNVTDRQFRVIAVDKEGTVHFSSRSGFGGTKNLYITTASFPDIARKQLEEYRFQVRPYEWVEFKDISLRPGAEALARPQSRAAPKRQAIETWLGEGQTRRIREQILILRECHIFQEMETWASAVRELVNIGKPAVPDLVDELRQTDRRATRSVIAFTLRAIGDRSAAPALIEVLGRSQYKGTYGVDLMDKDLAVFMQKHQYRPRPTDGKTQSFSIGCPVVEITTALEAITGHSEGHGHWATKALEELGRDAPPDKIQQRIRKKVGEATERWRQWWQGQQKTDLEAEGI